MALAGAVLLWRSRQRRLGHLARRRITARATDDARASGLQIAAFIAVVLFSTTIASTWTQDVVARYSSRHPGLSHSAMYPAIDTAPRRAP